MTLFAGQLELVLRGVTQAEFVELQRLAALDEPDGDPARRRGTALANARRVLGPRVWAWFLPLRPAG